MILAIESSCDESAIALFHPHRGLLGEWVSSQIELHAVYGGVVPDLASREHLNNFGPLLEEARRVADLGATRAIAVTVGPGLIGCLAMGLAVGQALSIRYGAPLFGVNHLRAHAHSPFIALHAAEPCKFAQEMPALLPHLALVVSGGNTLLAAIDEDRSIEILGQTIDDAAGEALDKGAKLLGFGYPGGPKLEQAARGGDPSRFDFPRALLGKPTLDFSFSGLKTSLRYWVEQREAEEVQACMADLCASYQEAVVDALVRKTRRALKSKRFRSLGLSGGVSNNALLRERFAELGRRHGSEALIAERRHTGDNAGMIAFSHYFEGADGPAAEGAGGGLELSPSLSIELRG